MDDFLTVEERLSQLGKRISALRIARGMTQSDLSLRTGISAGTIQRIESGIDTRLSTFIQILQSFGLDERLESLIPDQTLSPVQMYLNQDRIPKRCSSRKKKQVAEQAAKKRWIWGDEK